ncbi:MAG: PAS domain S-box protein [Candidatus Omnitrophica bacterium]|nr:PAS domain S-box protein [Candidatus Omnitrophota bacterium]
MKDKKQRHNPDIKVLLEYANSIIATLREPFLVLDKSLRVISSNQAFYTTFKVAEKETIGHPLPDLGDGQWNIPKLLELLKEIIPEKKIVTDYEVGHKFEHIGERTMVLNACQLRVPKKIAGIVTAGIKEEEEEEDEELILLAIEDITERKRLQEELKGSEERYRRAFETSKNVLLLVHKTGGDILSSNASARELLGYSQEEFLKKKLWEIGMVKDDKGFQEIVSILEKEGVVHYGDTPVKTKKGLSINTEIFLVDKAKVIQCNINDITERKVAEEALKEAEIRFKTIFNESMDGMLLAYVGTRRFAVCNPKICKMLGYTEEELMRMKVDDIHPEKDLPFVIKQFERQAKREIELAEGLPVKRKDGSICYADVNTSLITLAGKKYLMGSFRDVTERKKTEEALKEIVKAKSAFTSMVSHELRTPLSALKESISQVLEGMLGTLTTDQRKFLDIAKRNVDRLARLITEILDFQTLETGKIIFKIQDNDINEVIEETKETMNIIAKEKGLDFILNLDKDLPKIKFDRDKISQVLSNLVNNSLKLTEKGNITISTMRGNNIIQVSIKDTGPGIREEDIPRLFQQYEQLERKTGGTGLGLAISLEIIKAHGGKIWAESTFGQGTTMQFILPIEERRRRA